MDMLSRKLFVCSWVIVAISLQSGCAAGDAKKEATPVFSTDGQFVAMGIHHRAGQCDPVQANGRCESDSRFASGIGFGVVIYWLCSFVVGGVRVPPGMYWCKFLIQL